MHRPHDGRASAAETDADTAHSDCERHSTATSAPGLRSPRPNLKETGLKRRTTSASGPGSPLLHLQRERTRPLAISVPVCAGNGLTPATSANGTGLAWRQLSMPYCAGVTLTRRHGPGDVPRALCGSLRAVAYCEYSQRVYCEWEDFILDGMLLRRISYEFLLSLSVFSLVSIAYRGRPRVRGSGAWTRSPCGAGLRTSRS